MRARVVVSLEGAIVTEFELTQEVSVVGRHPACDICIDHPAISARHMLFRVVGSTVYVEDLASTNGTKVNGHGTQHQVIHHLDMVEVGRHRIHFFDDELLASGGVGNLETTVHTDFEKTMIAAHVPAAAARPAPRNDDLSRTMAIAREPNLRMGPAQEAVQTERAPSTAVLALRVLSGMHAGEVVSLDKANTMLGTAGADSALVVRRGDGYYLARFGGATPRLNRKDLEPGAHRIAPRDLIEVGNSRFEVITATR